MTTNRSSVIEALRVGVYEVIDYEGDFRRSKLTSSDLPDMHLFFDLNDTTCRHLVVRVVTAKEGMNRLISKDRLFLLARVMRQTVLLELSVVKYENFVGSARGRSDPTSSKQHVFIQRCLL